MEFLDPAKKRWNTIRLFTGYVLVGIAITIATLILAFQSYGYGFDRKTGAVIQNGLVFVDAQPESAEIYINDQLQKVRTSARLNLPAGQYTIELRREGYRNWKRSFNLEGSSIERLVYPRLFPEKLVTEDEQLYATTPAFATQSPDRRWMLVQQPGQFASFDVFDANNPDQVATSLTLPSALISNAPGSHSWKLAEWSTDNRHVLLEHVFEGGHEFILIDREAPANSQNLNKVFNINPTAISLRDKKYDLYYFFDNSNGQLQTGELKNRTLTPFANRVLAYKSHGSDQVLLITDEGAPQGKVLVKLLESNNSYTLRTLSQSDVYLVDLARFDGSWYVVSGSKTEGLTYIYKDPLNVLKRQGSEPPIPITTLKTARPDFVSFSANARFIMTQDGTNFAVYDIETNRRHYYDIKIPLDTGQRATWMDGHRLTVVSGGQVVVFDYDGINQQTLSPALAGSAPMFDRDYNALYSIAPSAVVPGRFALTRTELSLAP